MLNIIKRIEINQILSYCFLKINSFSKGISLIISQSKQISGNKKRKAEASIVNLMLDSDVINYAKEKGFYNEYDSLEEFTHRESYVNQALSTLRSSNTMFPYYEGLIIASDASFLWKKKKSNKRNICVSALSTSDGNVISANLRADQNNITDNNLAEYYSIVAALKYALEATDETQNDIIITSDSEYAINRIIKEKYGIITNNQENKNINIVKVKGHGHDYLNTVSDLMAKNHVDNIKKLERGIISPATIRTRNKRIRQGLRKEIFRMSKITNESQVKYSYLL